MLKRLQLRLPTMPAAIRRVALPLVVLCLASAARAGALPPNRNLAGGWQLFPDPHERYHAAALPAAGWRAVRVGLSIQAQFADLRSFAGAAWYRRDLRLPALPAGDSALLHIGACDYRCVVYLNGRRLAAHDGGYLPFDVDLTAAARLGRNRLLIRIADPPGPVSDFRASYAQIPHGKQNWYVQTSGLWQSVRLEFKPAYYILWAHVLSRRREVRGIRLRLAHAALIPAGARARVEAWGPDGTPAFKAELPLPAGQTQVTLPLAWRGRWWSPRHPRLYRFMVTLPDGDQRSGEFGLRSIAERDGRMYLNGRLFYMRAALDQAFYPRGIYTPPSLAYLMREMRQAQALGLNTLRLHIKVPDPRYLQAADRTGMLLWYEIPNWDRLTPLSERRAQTTLRRSIARDWNHPSLILQSIINESWGANLTVAWQRRWLQGMYVWAKAHLPNRLVDDNTACCANFHIQTDLADFHNYNSIPDHAAAWNHFVRAFAGRPKWLFSPYGDARPTGQEPLVLSEFGNWGLPLLPARKPWWFARGFNGNPITIPGGVDRRLRQSALGAVFPSYAALARATEGHEWQALRFEIESLRLQPSIQGYVITELTDVNWESNGLMTMWRRPKIFASQLAALQRPVIVIAQPDRPDYAPGATARLRLTVCNESPQAFTGGTIVLGGHRWPVPPVARGTVRQVAIAAFHLPLAATWRRPERQQASVAGRRSPATATSGSVQNRAAEPRAPRVDGGGAWARPQEVRVRLLRAGRVVDARTLRLA
ncbi:MAG: glycoside hydrolase family 2 protein, partial [Terriglobales bacterium]